MISQRALRAFQAFGESGSIASAAERLGRTAPQVGRLIQQLESETRLKLLDRGSRPPILTEHGHELLVRAERIISDIDYLDEFADNLRRGKSVNNIHIIVTPFVSNGMLADAIAQMMDDYPSLSISVEAKLRLDIEQWLANERFDLCITILPFANDAFEIEHLIDVEAIVVMNERHNLSSKKVVHFSDLAQYEIISMHRRSIIQQNMEKLFRASNLKKKSRFEAVNGIIACQMAGRGIGCCIAEPFIASSCTVPGMIFRKFAPTMDFSYAFLEPTTQKKRILIEELKRYIKIYAKKNYEKLIQSIE